MTTQALPDSMAPAAPMAFIASVVQLVNEGTETFTMKYGPRDRLTLSPGQSVFVQEEVGWHFLGRWWTDNLNPRNRARQEEVNRLRTLYGAYEDEVIWQANKPTLAAYTADGKRITTVVDDPDGTSMNPQAQTAFSREQSLEAQMVVLQSQLLQMQAQLDGKARTDADNAQPDVPADAQTAAVPPPAVAQMAGVSVPVAPPAIPLPPTPGVKPRRVPAVEGAAVVGIELPVNATAAYVPPAADDAPQGDVPIDAPARIPTGGRIPAGS